MKIRLLVSALVLSTLSVAQSDLRGDVPLLQLTAEALPQDLPKAAVRAQRVAVDAAALRSDRLRIAVMDGPAIRATAAAIDKHRYGTTWSGKTTAGGDVVITVRNGATSAYINSGDGRVYEIAGNILMRLDLSRFPPCATCTSPPDQPRDGSHNSDPVGPLLTGADSGDVEIDIMVVYTAAAEAGAMQNQGDILATIATLIQQADTAFENSNMDARFNLVHAEKVGYDEPQEYGQAPNPSILQQALNWVGTDSYVAALRDQHGADLVAMIVEDGNGQSGIGVTMREVGPGFAPNAFSVTVRNAAVGPLTFAHETGHNMGMEHDPETYASTTPALPPPSYVHSFGHRQLGLWRTVMAYPFTECGPLGVHCPIQPYFSNPNVLLLGVPTGLPLRNNALTGDKTAPTVAAFRSGPPTGLTLTSPVPGTAGPAPGTVNYLNVVGATPGDVVTYFWGTHPAQGSAPCCTGEVGIEDPVPLAVNSHNVGSSGTTTQLFLAPPAFLGLTVLFQVHAADPTSCSCAFSNTISHTFTATPLPP